MGDKMSTRSLLPVLLLFAAGCATVPQTASGPPYDPSKDYLEDSRMYFTYSEYEKAIQSALTVLKNESGGKRKAEACYYINESAEEIVHNLRSSLYLKSDEEIRKSLAGLKERYGISVVYKKAGYEYIFYYDKSYYDRLKGYDSESEFLTRIILRHFIRMSRNIVDNKYRYQQVMNIMDKYWAIYRQDPKAPYVPQLLLRMADLYLYLYEEGQVIKKDVNLTEQQLKDFFNQADVLYKKIKKEYADSGAAQSIAYVIENVKLRDEPTGKSKVLSRIPAGTLVKLVDRSEKKVEISNMYDYWYKVKLISGLEGWIYGFYLRTQY